MHNLLFYSFFPLLLFPVNVNLLHATTPPWIIWMEMDLLHPSFTEEYVRSPILFFHTQY